MDINLCYKIWLCNPEGEKFFGDGPCKLLEGVERLGSLNKAASEMNMAYSKAFKIIKNAEKNCGYKLLEREIGGIGGGGSKITEKGKELIKRYTAFEEEAKKGIEKAYEKLWK
ncbi:MAG: winged helix-turn-helix domain-containing protein [Eubacteriaceae bacterium]